MFISILILFFQALLSIAKVEAFGHKPPSLHTARPLSPSRSSIDTLSSSDDKNKQSNFLPSHRQRQQLGRFHLAPQQLGEFEPINIGEDGTTTRTDRRVWLYDFVTTSQSSNPKQIPYHEAWDLQKCLVEHQLSRIGKRPKDLPLYDQFVPSNLDQDISDDYVPVGDAGGRNFYMHNIINNIPSSFSGCDAVIILEHDPVYTLGTASDPSFIHGFGGENKSSSIPVVRIERGGEVTYHGPGQLTVYPILDLRGYKQDIHWYMRALEEVIIIALEKAGVKGASREDNLTGVWVSNKKIAALGIKTRRWVTMHGLAINVDIRSLQNFEGIVPCGLEGREVTCVNKEVLSDDAFSSPKFTLEDFTVHLKDALEEVFGITLLPADH